MNSKKGDSGLKVAVTNKQILSIALPISLAMLVPQVNILINSIFLGRLSPVALGNGGVTAIYYLIFAIAGNGFNNAMQTVFSRFAGSDKPSGFKRILTQGFILTFIFSGLSILFTWFVAPHILVHLLEPEQYTVEMNFLKIRILGIPFLYFFQLVNAFLISSLNSRMLIIGFIFQALINIFLDYAMIFGHFGFNAMGFNGAAWASVIAEFAGAILVFFILIISGLKKKYELLSTWAYDHKLTFEIFKLSLPLVLQYIISIATWLAFFLLIEEKGIMAKGISNTMRSIFGIAGIFVWALSGTTNVMVSNIIGQGKQEKVMQLTTRIAFWSFGLCAFMAVLLNIFSREYFLLFGQGESFVQAGIPVVRMVSLGLLFMSLANIWLNAVTGTGNTKVNLIIEIISIICYILYTWYFLKVNYISLAIAWSNDLIYWITILLMSYFYMRSGKWKKEEKIHV